MTTKIEKLRRIVRLISINSFIFLYFACHTSLAQFTLTGQSGSLLVPEARVIGDKKIAVGSGFHPDKEAFILYPNRQGSHEIHSFVTIGFLPFMELTFNLTQIINGGPAYGIGDRSGSMRFLLFKETDYRPAILLGTYIPFGTNNYLGSSFLTASKTFTVVGKICTVTAGYSIPYVLHGSLFHSFEDIRFLRRTNNYQKGLIVTSRLQVLKVADVCLEYDSDNFNSGVILKLAKNRLHAKLYSFNFQAVGGSISYQGSIK